MRPLWQNEDWKFSFEITTKCIREPVMATCSVCRGCQKLYDDHDLHPTECWRCHGSGKVETFPGLTPRPELPQGLMDHMKKAWIEYSSTMHQFNQYFEPKEPK